MTLFSHVLESSLIPSYYQLRGRIYPDVRNFLEKSQWWSREAIQHFQWQELQRLLEHTLRTVPYYKEKYAAAGVEYEISELRKIMQSFHP